MTTVDRVGALEVPWIWAGMTVADGLIDRPLDAGQWLGPAVVEIRGERLLCSGAAVYGMRPGMLEGFLALGDATDEELLAYASEYGSLTAPLRPSALDVVSDETPTRGHFIAWSESLEEWHLLAGHLRAVVDLAAAVHLDQRVEDETLESLQRWPSWKSDWGPPGSAMRERWERRNELALASIGRQVVRRADTPEQAGPPLEAVSAVMNGLFELAPSAVGFEWHPTPQVQIKPGSLFAGLVLQLSYAVARKDGLAVCSECSRPYIPKRRPAEGRKNYCPDCGLKAAWRNAQRRKRKGSN